MKRLLLLTLGLTMIGAAKAQEEKLEIKPSSFQQRGWQRSEPHSHQQ